MNRGFTMALFEMQEKVPEDKDKLMSLVLKGRKASGCVLAALLKWYLTGRWWALLWTEAALHHLE